VPPHRQIRALTFKLLLPLGAKKRGVARAFKPSLAAQMLAKKQGA
jgi:hypothetical protein